MPSLCPSVSRLQPWCTTVIYPLSGRNAKPRLATCRRSNTANGLWEDPADRNTPGQRVLAPQRPVGIRDRSSYQPSERSKILPRSLVVNKEVITRLTGTLLGVISHFYIDARTLSVVSMALRPKGLGMAPRDNLLLSTLCQIGDVALVHDETALSLPPLTEREGCMRFTGCDVQAHDGTLLGKVRDYSFSPDTGRIESIRYDPLGQPLVPESIMTVWEVRVEHVLTVNPQFLVLQPGAQEMAVLIHDGFIGQLYRGVQELLGGDEQDWGTTFQDPSYEEWKRLHGREFARYYGLQEVPATRSQADAVVRGTAAALPSPRQSVYSTMPGSVNTPAGTLKRRQLVDSAEQQAEPRYMSYATGIPYQDNRPGSSTGEDARGQIAQPSRGAWRANSRARMSGTGPLVSQADNFGVVDHARNGRPLRSGNTQPPSAPSSTSQQGRNLSNPDQVERPQDTAALAGMKRWKDWVQEGAPQRAPVEALSYIPRRAGTRSESQRPWVQTQGNTRSLPRD
eukprot:jgi/Botrbrau1/6686/Bobra.0202s0025.1